MKPTFKTRMMAMLPKNDYKFHEYCVEVFQHNGRLICAELAGDFHLGYARQLTDKSSLLFDLAF